MIQRYSSRYALIVLPILALILAACGAGAPGGNSATPTPTLAPGETPPPVNVGTGDRPGGSLSGLTQTLNLNGCRVTIPLEWISEGDGTGYTPANARFTIYGGPIADDADWEKAVQLVVDQANRKGATRINRGGDWVMAISSGDRGFTYRVRVNDGHAYCDFSVSNPGAIPDKERDSWNAIAGSVRYSPTSEGTPAA